MQKEEFIRKAVSAKLPEQGSVTWEAPSNIALVKYWGKYQNQIPANPSISFTLSEAKTKTKTEYRLREKGDADFQFFFEGREKPEFLPKLRQFFERIEVYMPYLKEYHFSIYSENSFPHSSGIASSASSMAALAMCLMDIERRMFPEMDEAAVKRKASFLARLGSGSACRSIWGPLVTWGEHADIPNSSDLYATPYALPVAPVFSTFRDTVLLVEQGVKAVSSTKGHDLMHSHRFAGARFEQAKSHLKELRPVLASGDLDTFIRITESEALSLHAMMLTSQPYFILMKPNTLKIIEEIWAFRRETSLPVAFTLDAGANVHLLFPEEIAVKVDAWTEEVLKSWCEGGNYLKDKVGSGVKKC